MNNLLPPQGLRKNTITILKGRAVANFSLFTIPYYLRLLILSAVILRLFNLPQFDFLKSLLTVLCVNMSKISRSKERSGEYRGRTDDLLHAMQAL